MARSTAFQVINGAKDFLDSLKVCEERIYYCAMTIDKLNPLDRVKEKLLPKEAVRWEDAKKSFCWLPYSRILDWIPLTRRGTANV